MLDKRSQPHPLHSNPGYAPSPCRELNEAPQMIVDKLTTNTTMQVIKAFLEYLG
jgi:hypothetical protein